jgi:hypothetical protein
MKQQRLSFSLKLSALLVSQALFVGHAMAASGATSDCDANVADSLTQMFTCGTVHGSLRALDYSTHNAYFAKGYTQDTFSYGGSLKYTTAEYYGLSFGLSGIFQRGIDHNQDHLVSELGSNQTGFGEAYIKYHYKDFSITAGDQRLSIPFVGDYDWRITPILYRAVDANYGDADNFLHATKITRFKFWGDTGFHDRTQYTNADGGYQGMTTNGMWAVGGGRAVNFDNKKLTGQLWYEDYNNYTKLYYADSYLSWTDTPYQPKIGLQVIRGLSSGNAVAGEVNSTTYGAQFAMNFTPSLRWSLNWDHIAASNNAYGDGALVTPYSHNASSGPYFAQPFFTSTQDLGSGNAYGTDLNWSASSNISLGTRYTFMDLTPSSGASSTNQSEYLVYGTYSFDGALKGLSVTDFAGVQTTSNSAGNFWQNRLSLEFDF